MSNNRRERLARAEEMLDRWLDIFGGALDEARPDPSKTTEFANVFTILKRIREIELLEHKLDAETSNEGLSRLDLDRRLFGDGFLGQAEDG